MAIDLQGKELKPEILNSLRKKASDRFPGKNIVEIGLTYMEGMGFSLWFNIEQYTYMTTCNC